jgi:uncharacterized alpha/beta hydrolase family protein
MKHGTVHALAMVVLAALLIVWTTEGTAQKSKKTQPKPEQTQQQEITPTPVVTGVPQTKSGNTIKDALNEHRGEKTSLGILSKVERDYFVIEEDGVSTLYPFSAIAHVRFPKIEDGDEDPVKVEIKLL